MKILMVGNGGREHALLWRLVRDCPSGQFIVTRGTPGMTPLARSADVEPTNIQAICDLAAAEKVDLVVVGPEVPLARGLADRLTAAGVPVFGPSAAAARIETSKVFAKDLMREVGVPTAAYRTFSDFGPALEYARSFDGRCVVKADGLAAGKGAVVCRSLEQAEQALQGILLKREFGAAGDRVVIEELMQGEELSVLVLVDGARVAVLSPSQDHKAVGEGDTGPNTGGMGSYSPVGVATPELLAQVERTILLPVVRALAERGAPYRGCLYAGLMLTAEGPKVVEFNCRFGDPETQVVLPLLEGDLVELLTASATGSLAGLRCGIRQGAAVCVVLASGGYPGSYERGKEITFGPAAADCEDLIVFHAGTAEQEGRIVTAGGRVLGVTGLGRDVRAAAERAYGAVDDIAFTGRYCRRDIAWREIRRYGSGN